MAQRHEVLFNSFFLLADHKEVTPRRNAVLLFYVTERYRVFWRQLVSAVGENTAHYNIRNARPGPGLLT